MVTATAGSPTTLLRVSSTASTETPGKMRQFTLALARWGSALVAWPPESSVATHVVWMTALEEGSAATTA